MNLRFLIAEIGVFLSRAIVLIHDILTFPIYVIINQPWKHWKSSNKIWSGLEREDDPYSPYVRKFHRPSIDWEGVQTVCDLFRTATAHHGNSDCFGTREVFGEEEHTTKSGKVLKKLSLGNYKWMTYNEVDSQVESISKGLLSIGITSKKPIVLFGETRVEWIIIAQACFRVNVPVVTVYATLGEEGLAHGINETEVTHVITSLELLPKLINIFDRIPAITHVVYMEGLKAPNLDGIPSHVKVTSFSELMNIGKDITEYSYVPPTADDLAILMYTSGSTGVPKGVMLSNKNIISTIKGFSSALGTDIIKKNDVYVAYLPVAHVMELASECYISSLGIPIGFSTPQTLTDFSTAVKKGCPGDLKVLQPTLLTSVPLMLDRIRKSILTLAGTEGTFSRGMFDFAISYKHFWSQRGFETPRLNRNWLEKYQTFLGGRLRFVMCGGAPISPDTQNFIRCCLDVKVLQGYGATETAACSNLTDVDDLSSGNVGAPLSTCKIRLVDWAEGGYYVTDQPHPRGEIVIGGDCVSKGYFKREEETKECFREEDGIRWFYSGDIGEVYPNGTFRIIDRKKDLVKLQFGEYVALGKVEAELKTCPLVENVCVFGNSFHNYLVALVVPNKIQLTNLAKRLGKEGLTFAEMCLDNEIVSRAVAALRDHGVKCRLFGSEIPTKVKLCSDEWHPDSGLVTAAFKLRRNYIQQRYQDSIDEMYSTRVSNGSVKSA